MPDSQPDNGKPRTRPAGRRSPAGLAIAAVLLGMVGGVDYLTGVDVSVSFFYLLPICLAVWSGGLAAGVTACLLAVCLWTASNVLCGEKPDGTLFWNATMRLGLWATAAVLLDLLIRNNQKLRDIRDHARWF